MSIESSLRALAARWAEVPAGESANFPLYIRDLADALEVEPPRPRGSGYELELPVKVTSRDGRESTNFIDLYKEGCFVLEAKHSADAAASNEALLRRAYGQALSYAHALPGGPPPYVLVLDVARTLLVWDRWAGSFGGFNLAHRIHLPTLAERPEDIALLRDVWTQPAALVEQLAALQELLAAGPATPQDAAARFRGASAPQVRERLETLAGAGEAWVDGEGRYHRVGVAA